MPLLNFTSFGVTISEGSLATVAIFSDNMDVDVSLGTFLSNKRTNKLFHNSVTKTLYIVLG